MTQSARSPYLDAEVLPSQAQVQATTPAPLEHALAEPARPMRQQETPLPRHLRVVDGAGQAVTDGEYNFHQGTITHSGKLGQAGLAMFGKVDPAQPFRFEVRDRVCTIRYGACLDPDDAALEYGGTWFDWTLVRDDRNPERDFWPHYKRQMDLAFKLESYEVAQGRRLERFAQHEHITRRDIRIAKPLRATPGRVQICALPARARLGPFVRYADHERALIWLETVTPCMVRVRFRPQGSTAQPAARFASTVRVGGRHFAAVEIGPLLEDRFHDYAVDLAPLPAQGAVPVREADFTDVFPPLTLAVMAVMKKQFAIASVSGSSEWLSFRTLRRRYERLRFATGSCRWYPGDKKAGKDWGPDMLDRLGQWLITKPKAEWPHFMFFGGDQIYADEIGDDHGQMMVEARFASRIPGPAASSASTADRLVDGAWAGRFAHRYRAYADPPVARVTSLRDALAKLDELQRRFPDLKSIATEYPDLDPEQALKKRYDTLLTRRTNSGAHGEADDEKRSRQTLEALPAVKRLQAVAEPMRAFMPHWNAGFSTALRANPMARRFLNHNFLLWNIPVFAEQLPTLSDANVSAGVRTPQGRGHPSAEAGRHAADFAEYAYLYERAWSSSRPVRVLMAQLPSFLMFDDHEATDDWNFSVEWVRMLHNRKDDWRMWPKTLTDALAAYWVYQGWGNKALSAWDKADPRIKALAEAQSAGKDALPALRRVIHAACFAHAPSNDLKAAYQAGLGLDWHYKLPFDPPFLVPDCRTRKRLVPADDALRVIDHAAAPAKRPQTQTIDEAQLRWMRAALVGGSSRAPVAFIAPSTPLMLQLKLMDFMLKPEVAARAWAQDSDVLSIVAALFSSTALGIATDKLITVFRRGKDLEHMMRERSWRDLWSLVDDMRRANSPVKTLVLVSGDVHHSYCMTANLPGRGRTQPELLQITSSGMQSTIRPEFQKAVAGALSSEPFDINGVRLAPGYLDKNASGMPQVALYQNAVAIVDVTLGAEVQVDVTHLAGSDRHRYRYTSAASYAASAAPGVPGYRGPARGLHEVTPDDLALELELELE